MMSDADQLLYNDDNPYETPEQLAKHLALVDEKDHGEEVTIAVTGDLAQRLIGQGGGAPKAYLVGTVAWFFTLVAEAA